jgi:hypothetical protein
MAAWALLVAAGAVAAASPPAPLALRVIVPATVSANEPRDISVMIANGGTATVLVLPNRVSLRIEGSGAQYVPYPGPPIDPWGDARELAPGATATVVFSNASDKRGIWRLPPGNYRIIPLYDVPPDLVRPATIADRSPVWRGHLEGSPALMNVK